MKEKTEEKKSKHDNFRNAAISGATADTVQRYGAAVKEHITAYSGVDNEAGKHLAKGLKDISNSKTNPDYYDQNIKQQAGFSAEVKAAARENAEKAIAGEKTRTTRTDDMKRQSDGKGGSIGGKNEQYYDLAEVDKNGIYVEGSGRQLKFVGGTADECANKLLSKKYDKYRNADVDIEVPSDFYDEVQKNLSNKAAEIERQIAKAESNGNSELVDKLKEKLQRIEDTKKHLRKSNVSNKESVFAREHPKLSTAQDIVKVSHRAGVEAAKEGAIVGGGISVIKNMVSLIKGDEDAETALVNVAKDTGTAMAVGYSTGFAGSVVKGAMQNAKSSTLQAASKTNLPATLVTTALSTGKTMTRLFKGEINGLECFEELGENGVTMIASSMGTVIGQAAIPIPIVGAVIGSMVGYAIASSSYGVLLESLKDAKLAHEERIRIEAECAEHIVLIREYRAELEQNIGRYLSSNIAVFSQAFDDMKSALSIGDIDGFISGTSSITKVLGKSVQFETMDEFDALMNSSNAFKI